MPREGEDLGAIEEDGELDGALPTPLPPDFKPSQVEDFVRSVGKGLLENSGDMLEKSRRLQVSSDRDLRSN